MTRRSFLRAASSLVVGASLPAFALPSRAADVPPLALPFPRMGDHFRVIESTLLRATLSDHALYSDEVVTRLPDGRMCRAGEQDAVGDVNTTALQPLEAVNAPIPVVGTWAFVSGITAAAHTYATSRAPFAARHVHGEQAYVADELVLDGTRWLGIADGSASNALVWTRAEQWRMRLTAPAPDEHIDRVTVSRHDGAIVIVRAGVTYRLPVCGLEAEVRFSELRASDLIIIGSPGGSHRTTASALTTEPAFVHWWHQIVPADARVKWMD